MLRCPPSRITLTSSDIADFEQRHAARRSTRLRKGKTAKVRLSPGPAHSTRLSLVPAEHNIGRQRAASSSSEATIHTDGKDNAEHRESPPSTDTIHTEELTQYHSAQSHQTNSTFDRLSPPRPSFLAATPRRQVDSFYGTEQAVDIRTSKNEPASNVPSMDGLVGVQPHIPPTQARCIPWTPRGNEVLDEISSDAYPVTRQPRTEPPLLASARARRRQARREDVGIFQEPDEIQEWTMRLYNDEPVSRRNATTAFAVPALVLPVEDSDTAAHATLDPGAPIFMPRTRFGTATGSSGETSNLQVNVARVPADLQVRSSSEQNANPPSRARYRQHHDNVIDFGSSLTGQPAGGRPRRRSRTADQNIALPHMTPALDRYPLMHPIFSSSDGPYASNLQLTQNTTNRQQHTRLISSPQEPGAPFPRESHLQVRNVSTARNGTRAEDNDTRSVSPALSASSRSTPNLSQHPGSTPQFSVRGSSLPWSRIDSRTPSFGRVPSMVSAASGISDVYQAIRQSSREALDAAAEFLRMRNSPLDDLTEQFSRMSTNRPRSVGRSWERPPRPRVSLLAGDPFGPEPRPDVARSSPITSTETTMRAVLPEMPENPDTAPEDIVALAMALPPSSPLRSSSIALPSTPSLHFSELTSPQSPLRESAKAKSPESAIKRKPVPAPATTPKVPVYDDSKPPNTQPQTPADVRGSKRHAKTRSDTTVLQPLVFVGKAIISSPPPIPERLPHRYTYPSTAPAQNNATAEVSTSTSFTDSTTVNVQVTRQNRSSRRARAQHSTEQAENELEGHLQGLEEDRRTWLGRREGGDLDVTPPREGRFERYLS